MSLGFEFRKKDGKKIRWSYAYLNFILLRASFFDLVRGLRNPFSFFFLLFSKEFVNQFFFFNFFQFFFGE